MRDDDDMLDCLFTPLTRKEKFYRFCCRNFPHKWYSKRGWYWPVWWVYIFSGDWDSGNGGGWYPGIYRRWENYYKEEWWKDGYTIWNWCCYPTKTGTASERKKLNVQPHGLW